MLVHLKICVSRTPPSAPHILFSDRRLDGIRASTRLKWHPYIVFVHQVLLELVIPYPVPALKIILILIIITTIFYHICAGWIETVWKINMVLSDHNYREKTSHTNPFYLRDRRVRYF